MIEVEDACLMFFQEPSTSNAEYLLITVLLFQNEIAQHHAKRQSKA